MKNTNFRNFTNTILSIFTTILVLTIMASAAVKPELISKTPGGNGSNGNSRNFSVSADGRFIVFHSDATDLVSGLTDTNAGTDIFLRDTLNGTLRCISLANATTTANNISFNPVITPNGRYVVFASKASNLVSITDTNNDADIFRFDTITNQMDLVTKNTSGTATGNDYSGLGFNNSTAYDISDDGRFIAFVSRATNFSLTSDTNTKNDVFVRDMNYDTFGTRLVSINKNGTAAGNNENFNPSISADGNIIAFTSLADDLIPSDGNVNYDVFYYNYQTQVTKCASMSTRTDIVTTGNSASTSGVISKDGSRIVYFTYAIDVTNIPIPFANPYKNVIVHDIGFGVNTLVTISTTGTAAGNNDSGIGDIQGLNASISPNGRYVTFESKAGNLSPLTASPGTYNVFRRDLSLGITEVVSMNANGLQAGTQNSFVGAKAAAMSSDGRFITFYSGDANQAPDFPGSFSGQFYVRDMVNKITTALTLNYAGTALGNASGDFPRISANGKSVVFSSSATDLTATTTSGMLNLFKSLVPAPQKAVADFDGDGRTDFSVFRPSNGAWYFLNSDATFASYRLFGTGADTIVPADYSGDGRTDYAVFRPSNGTWYISDGLNFNETIIQFGQNGDKPIPEDFDGDGKDDVAVYRSGVWYSISSQTGQAVTYPFGLAGDIPVRGDFDGDTRADYAVYRPSNGTWYIRKSSNGTFLTIQFGLNGDKPVAADYDGDGKTDIGVYRNGTWYIFQSRDNSVSVTQFGLATDKPSVGSFDADGKADIAVFRPSDGTWYILRSTNGASLAVQFGQNGDAPVPSAFVP
jgi:Tol biopolymer transport system component